MDLAKVPESDRLAFYGALFAIAVADGSIDKEEMNLVFETMNLEGMSEAAKHKVQSYIVEPPPLWESLRAVSTADDTLRFGLMFSLLDTAWADDLLDPNEEKAVRLAQQELRIKDEQIKAIRSFIQKMREIRARGLDDDQAADAMKTAAAGLSAVGIPIAAVYFSGSVLGLSAAGITSGLAALGLGFGMVPGIGIAVLVGAGLFMGLSHVLDIGGNQEKERLRAERERKAQLVIKNLHEMINGLTERIQNLTTDTGANREEIQELADRLKSLQKILAKRKLAIGVVQ